MAKYDPDEFFSAERKKTYYDVIHGYGINDLAEYLWLSGKSYGVFTKQEWLDFLKQEVNDG